jgi:hypothetical protein
VPEDATTIEIEIEYSEFIAGRELVDVLNLCDEAVWTELERLGWPPFWRFSVRRYRRPDLDDLPPFFCVSRVGSGSLLISSIIGGVALKYCYDRFWKGFRRSGFGDSVEDLSSVVGDRAASIVTRISGWLGRYEEEAKAQKSNIKSIKVKRRGA